MLNWMHGRVSREEGSVGKIKSALKVGNIFPGTKLLVLHRTRNSGACFLYYFQRFPYLLDIERAGPAELSGCQTKCPGHFC